jgi:hypothetical protein
MAGEHARLSLRRTGGLAGLPMEASLDTRTLAPSDAAAILRALETVDLDQTLGNEDWPAGAADTFHYDLKVQRGQTTQTATFSERQLPAELAQLVHTLMNRAVPGARED